MLLPEVVGRHLVRWQFGQNPGGFRHDDFRRILTRFVLGSEPRGTTEEIVPLFAGGCWDDHASWPAAPSDGDGSCVAGRSCAAHEREGILLPLTSKRERGAILHCSGTDKMSGGTALTTQWWNQSRHRPPEDVKLAVRRKSNQPIGTVITNTATIVHLPGQIMAGTPFTNSVRSIILTNVQPSGMAVRGTVGLVSWCYMV